MALSFFPVGGFSNPGINKTVECPPSGTDADCQGDKYEACILDTACGGVSCPAKEQFQLATFLDCFEGQHSSQMVMADSCAADAGLNITLIRDCFDDAGAKEAAWLALQITAAAALPSVKCFPWIEVEGKVESLDYTHGCFGKDAGTTPLLPLICAAAAAGAAPVPEACGTVQSVE